MGDGKFRVRAIRTIVSKCPQENGSETGVVIPRGMQGECRGATRDGDGGVGLYVTWDWVAVHRGGEDEPDELGAVVHGWEQKHVSPEDVETVG